MLFRFLLDSTAAAFTLKSVAEETTQPANEPYRIDSLKTSRNPLQWWRLEEHVMHIALRLSLPIVWICVRRTLAKLTTLCSPLQ